MKVVINARHGGFGLSDAAFEKFLARKGIAWGKKPRGFRVPGGYGWHEYYHAGHLGEDEHYLYSRNMIQDRSDPDLIAVVEEMGKEANGFCAELKVIEIPDDVEWEVEEYDGLEWIAEKHRTWN